MTLELQTILLVFGIAILLVLLTRKAIKKVSKDRAAAIQAPLKKLEIKKNKLTDEQFTKTWKSLSYLLLLVAAGSLYMVYIAVKSALDIGLFIYWIDACCSLLAAVAAVMIWKTKTKTWTFAYFILTMIPIMILMSVKGQNFKISALIHLFPLVLLYFVLKPVWENLGPEM